LYRLAGVVREGMDGKLQLSIEGQMPQYKCSTRAVIVPCGVSGMWSFAGTRAAAAKGVDTLVRLTPASRSVGL
jgi:hypothetical protein